MPYLFLAAAVLILDQATKLIVQGQMSPFQNIPLIPDYLALHYTMNYGAAFSMLWSQRWLLILITLAVFAVVWAKRKLLAQYPQRSRIGMAVALGGALGNLTDRIRLGYVVDFIYLHFRSVFGWPVFNVADMAIVAGVGLIIWGILFQKKAALPGATLEEKAAEE